MEHKHKDWKASWFSNERKYPPISNFDNFECIKEVTDWSDSEIDIPSHTYVLNGGGSLCGYFPGNDYTNWVEFKIPLKLFSKTRRKFVKVKIDLTPMVH